MSAAAAATPEKIVLIGGIKWHATLSTAQIEAEEHCRPLLLHFGENPGWHGCQLFAQGPLSNRRVIARVNADFVPVFIDTLTDHDTTKQFGESYGSYPVLRVQNLKREDLCTRLDGNLVHGKLSVEQVLAVLDEGLSRFRQAY